MGQGQSGGINVSPEQMQQLISETGLERNVLVSLADVFASTPKPVSTSSSSSPPPPAAAAKSPFPKLTLRKGSLAPGGPPPEAQRRKSSLKPQDISIMDELPLEVFAKLLQNANICHADVSMRMASLFDKDGSGTISLREFLISMALLLRGSPQEKLSFLFKSYDVDQSGELTVEEVELISSQMLHTYVSKGISVAGIEAEQVVKGFMHNLDANGDGVITEEEFVTEGLKNPKLIPLLVNHNLDLGDAASGTFKLLQAARSGKADRVRTLLKEVGVDSLGDQGETALYLAARKHLLVAQILIEHGANPNISHFSGQTPMHRAVLSGMTEMVDLLMSAGANVNTPNSLDGWTPFHCAVMSGNILMVKHLLKLKADPLSITSEGMTALHIAAAYDRAMLIPILSSQFECNIDINAKARMEFDYTAMHFACQECNLNVLKALLDNKALVDPLDSNGLTPLGVLCKGANRGPQMEECAKLLLQRRTNTMARTLVGQNTPLHIAALSNNTILTHLIAVSNHELMRVTNADGFTPVQIAQREAQQVLLKDYVSDLPDNTRKLLDACRQNDITKMKDALSKGGDPDADDGSGNTALYFCILNKSVEGVVLLLQAGAKTNQENERGSPLHAAIVTGQVPLVTALLDKKADPQQADKQWGMKALHSAAFFGKPEIVQLLVARQAADVNELSRGNKRPIHWAAQRGQVESVERLLALGADKECVANDGLTPLLSAAANGRSGVVQVLIAAGANVEVLAPEGRTALHLAAKEGDVTSMGLLLKACPKMIDAVSNSKDNILHSLCLSGALEGLNLFQPHDVLKQQANSANSFGQYPLHLACRHANLPFVAALLHESLGTDVHVADKDGVSPIYYASAANKEDVILMLKSRGAMFREEKISNDLIRFESSTLYPKIQSATIDALVDYLIVTCDKIDDSNFRDNFFLAYRQLIKPSQLMDLLLGRFNEAMLQEPDASGFVPNIRASSMNVLAQSAASGRDLGARRGSLSGREKRVGLKATIVAAPVAAAPAKQTAYVLIPENPLRAVLVVRAIRRWLIHSPMDFNIHLAGANGGKKREITSSRLASKSFGNLRGQMVKEGTFILPKLPPLLRGTNPEENLMKLQKLVDETETSNDEELAAEIALLEKALAPSEAQHLTSITPSGSSSTSAGRKGSAATIKSSFLDWSAEQSALQLTHMSKRLWDSLSLWEFYDVAFTKKDKDELCPNINALIRHVNRVGDWAKTLVLLHEDTKKRSQALAHVISVMDHCLKVRNLSDCMGLVTALQSTSLERLSKTWKLLPEDSVATLKKIKDIFDPRSNYKNLRKLFEERSNEPMVPFIGLIMGDLIHADEVTSMIDGRHNWYKYELLARLLAVIPKYQKLKYSSSTVFADREFVSMFEKTEFLDSEQVRTRSRELEPPEN